jgi:hypothetical protein
LAPYRITVDTGGTFSDFGCLDEATGAIAIAKVPSTPDDPSRAILEGIETLLAGGIRPGEISFFCHGTTVGTNALLERKGAKTGLLVTEGFRGRASNRLPYVSCSRSSARGMKSVSAPSSPRRFRAAPFRCRAKCCPRSASITG